MAFRAGQHNFSKGVLSKDLWGRSDIVPYGSAVRQGINVVVLKYGGLQKRPGTRFVYEIVDGAEKRLLPFEGAFEASYAMVMGQASMRLASQGGMVLEQKLTVEAVALTNPVAITASYHGLSSGDEVFFSGVEGALWLNGRTEVVTSTGTHTFTIPVDGTGLDARTGDTGGIIRSGAPSAPPAPPTVPPPSTPPPPPTVGTGGGGGGSIGDSVYNTWHYGQEGRPLPP